MCTTVTLDSDAEQMVRRRMAERRVTFEQALNDLIREGQTSTEGRPQFSTKARPMGFPTADLDKALRLVDELEDAELIRRLETGS